MNNEIEPPRNPRIVVLQAELLASSPERVRSWLEARAAKLDRSTSWGEAGNEATIESALLERNDPLINLSLARFAARSETLHLLLIRAGQENKPVRLAVLMNEVVGRLAFYGMPLAILKATGPAKDDDAIKNFVSSLDIEEVTALFANPNIEEDFLTDFFEQKEPWQVLDEPRRLAAIEALRSNPRMRTDYEGPMDGWAEYRHGSVFSAAWRLAGRVPVTAIWASQLSWLYEKTRPEAHPIKDPLQLAARWFPEPSDLERIDYEKKNLERGQLGIFAHMRQQIARLALGAAHSNEARRLLASHEDAAVRAAFYAHAPLSVEDMKAANERDFGLAFDQMMWNINAWRTKAQRDLLHDMAWDSKRDPNSRLDAPNTYNARREFYEEKYPAWFKDEEESSGTDTEPVTAGGFNVAIADLKGDLSTSIDLARETYSTVTALLAMQEQSDHHSASAAAEVKGEPVTSTAVVRDIHAAVTKLLTRTAWLAWGLVAVLALLLFTRL